MSKIILVLLFFLATFFSTIAMAQTYQTMPSELPVKVKIGFSIDDIIEINERRQTVTFDGILTIKWKDERLSYRPKNENDKLRYYTDQNATSEINNIWHPHVVLVDLRGSPDMYASYLTISPEGEVTHVKRFIANIENPMNFTKFPFETQEKIFGFQSLTYNAKQLVFVKMPSKEQFFHPKRLEEWRLINAYSAVKNVLNPLYKEKFSRYSVILKYQRRAQYYFFQTLLPLFLIVLFSFSIFWMMNDPVVNRAAITLTAILTIVVFEWQIFGILPHIAYLTFMDILILFSFIIVMLTLVPSIMYNFIQDKRRKAIVVRLSRWGFPILYFLGIFVMGLFYHFFA